jgi:hypothetical protein
MTFTEIASGTLGATRQTWRSRPNGGAGRSAWSLEGHADPPLCRRSRGCVHHIARTHERNEPLTPRFQ